MTSPAGTERLFKRLPHEDKQFQIYDGYEHGKFSGSVKVNRLSQ